MRNIKLLLSYDGTEFSGWQRQPDRRTVQQALEEALGRLTGVEPPTNASGRTDAGVHALGQVVHFYTASSHTSEVFVKALNAMLPGDVRVLPFRPGRDEEAWLRVNARAFDWHPEQGRMTRADLERLSD